jgi:predicted alpha/beta-fold hydrolase
LPGKKVDFFLYSKICWKNWLKIQHNVGNLDFFWFYYLVSIHSGVLFMSYSPSWWLRSGHFQSIYPSLFRKLDDQFFVRERIETPDNDFLDLDWACSDHKRLVILTHGLEGHSRRPYMLGMATAAAKHGWDALAWNFRSCSGEPNRRLSSYHSGATDDLETVINYAKKKSYKEIALVGFSIGGNKTLKYLGMKGDALSPKILGSVVFSVPCDLTSGSKQLALRKNAIYMKNFLSSLKQKLKDKQNLYPNEIDLKNFSKIKNFYDFDSQFTAPMNGFESAEEYWTQSSSKQYLEYIKVPTLMVSAKNDPFLTPECFPYELVEKNAKLTLETPEFGGHVGFMTINKNKHYWSEQRAMDYLGSLSLL